jgi:glycosyltransferase EpsD
VSSVITRLAAQKFREEYGLKVLYTAHGFHFFKGSPLSYWLLYYPVEKFFSKYLDCLITINREDYELATTKFHCKDVRRISGMGVNPSRFANVSEDQKMDFRNSLGIKKNDFVLVYVAEFIDRKNHAFLIENAEKIRQLMPDVKIIFSGRGMLMRKMQSLASKLRVLDMIIFLGFRNDVNVVISSSDIGISVSKQEGLGLHLVECMFCNLPVIASQDRGHREIIQNGFNGYIFEQGDIDSFIDLVNKLKHDQALYKMLSKNAVDSSKRFQLQVALKELGDIYMHYTR